MSDLTSLRNRGRKKTDSVVSGAMIFAVATVIVVVINLSDITSETRTDSRTQTPSSHHFAAEDILMTNAALAEIRATLVKMDDTELNAAYITIDAAFRNSIGHDDLSVARALCDYAILVEAELTARGRSLPPDTIESRDMLLLYELVLR